MRTKKRSRRWSSAEVRSRILKDYGQSELSQKAFAAQAGIGLSTLHSWLRRQKAPAPNVPSTFIELPQVGSSGVRRPVYRLEFTRGWSLEVAEGFRAEELRQFCQILSSL